MRQYRSAIMARGLLPALLLVPALASPAAPVPQPAPAAESGTPQRPKLPMLRLEALLGSRAVISLDGRRAILAPGESGPRGLRLLSLRGEQATVSLDGREYRLRLGQGPIARHYAAPETTVVSIAPDPRGMYFAEGAINGQPVRFLVDTGATSVAMNATDARRLGIDFRLHGRPVLVETASGRHRAWRVRLRSVSLGGIRRANVAAVVLEGGFPQQVLLGMSFLGELKIQRQGTLLELRQVR